MSFTASHFVLVQRSFVVALVAIFDRREHVHKGVCCCITRIKKHHKIVSIAMSMLINKLQRGKIAHNTGTVDLRLQARFIWS